MTLNSEGLEKAADALAKIYHGEGDEPFHLMATTAITAYLSALPPVDGLEVVAHAYVVEGECEQIEWGSDVLLPDDPSLVELTPLSQASSVIAGLREELVDVHTRLGELIDEDKQAWAKHVATEIVLGQQKAKTEAAEARVSSLEEENKRLREALKPFAEAGDNTDANDDYSSASIWEHPCAMDITIGDLRRARRICLQTEDHNG
jgi:hypothetical protein